MKVTCQKCGRDYQIKDEFVRKSDLKMKCRGCGNLIVVKKISRGVPPPPIKGVEATRATDLPTVKSEVSGVDEFDLSSSPSVPPSKGKTIMGGGAPPPPPSPKVRKSTPSLDDPFADLPGVRDKSPSGTPKDFEFGKLPVAKKDDKLDFSLDLPGLPQRPLDEPQKFEPAVKVDSPPGDSFTSRKEEGALPPVLSPSSAVSDVKKGKEQGFGGGFGEIDLPAPAKVEKEAVEEEKSELKDIFGSLDQPPLPQLKDEALAEEHELPDIKRQEGKEEAEDKLQTEQIDVKRKFVSQAGGTSFGEIDLGEEPEELKQEDELSAGKHEQEPGDAPIGAPEAEVEEGGIVEVDGRAMADVAERRSREEVERVKKKEKEKADKEWVLVKRRRLFVYLLTLIILGGGSFAIWKSSAYQSLYKGFSKYILGKDIDAYFRMRDRKIAGVRNSLGEDEIEVYREGIKKLIQIYQANKNDKYLGGYISFLITAAQLRFGAIEGDMVARAEAILKEIPYEEPYVKVFTLASAAQSLLHRSDMNKVLEEVEAQLRKDPADVDFLFLAAVGYLKSGDGQRAYEYFEKLSKVDGGSKRSRFGMIRALFRMGSVEEGDELLDGFLKEYPDFLDGLILRARRFVDSEDLTHAEALISRIKKIGNLEPFHHEGVRVIEGVMALKRDEYEKARQIFEQVLSKNNQNVSALIGMGMIEIHNGNAPKALARFNMALGIDPLNVEGNFGLVECYIKMSRFKEARALLDRMAVSGKDDYRFYIVNARLQEAVGNTSDAEESYKKAIEKNEKNIDSYIELASLYYKQGRTSDALRVLELAKKRLPMTPKLLTAFARGDIVRGEFNSAYEKLNEAIGRDPLYVHANFYMGVSLYKLGKYEEALGYFKKVAEHTPAYPKVVLYQGLVFEAIGDMGRALEYYKKALESKPDDEDILIRAASIYIGGGEYGEARKLIERVLEKNPGRAEAVYYLGRILMGEGRFAEALHHFDRATRITPDVGIYYLWAARAAERIGNFSDALGFVRRAIEKDPALPEAYLLRGRIRTRMGMLKDGKQDLLKALSLKPDLNEAYGPLGIVYEEERNFAKAKEAYIKYLSTNGGDIEVNVRLAMVLYDQGNIDGANNYFSKTYSLCEGKLDVTRWCLTSIYYLGLIQQKKGNREKAKSYFKEYLKRAPDSAIDRSDVVRRLRAMGEGVE